MKIKNYFRKLILTLNGTNNLLFKISKFIVNSIENINNSDISSNGELFVIKKFINKCHQLFDVGAGDGEYLNFCLKENRNLEIYAFEPSERIENIPKSQKITAYNIGLGNDSYEVNLYLNNSGGAPSIIESQYKTNNEIKQIKICRFDTIVKKEKLINRINFLKIDVEGYEFEVLKGMEEYIKLGLFNFIQFEYSGYFFYNNITLNDLVNYVKDLNPNFDVYKIFQNKIVKLEKITVNHENYQDSNFLFILKGFEY